MSSVQGSSVRGASVRGGSSNGSSGITSGISRNSKIRGSNIKDAKITARAARLVGKVTGDGAYRPKKLAPREKTFDLSCFQQERASDFGYDAVYQSSNTKHQTSDVKKQTPSILGGENTESVANVFPNEQPPPVERQSNQHFQESNPLLKATADIRSYQEFLQFQGMVNGNGYTPALYGHMPMSQPPHSFYPPPVPYHAYAPQYYPPAPPPHSQSFYPHSVSYGPALGGVQQGFPIGHPPRPALYATAFPGAPQHTALSPTMEDEEGGHQMGHFSSCSCW